MKLLFDIGGTKTRLAWAKSKQKFSGLLIFSTPRNYQDFLKIFKKSLAQLPTTAVTQAVGGLPGTLDSLGKKLLRAPNLPAWVNRPVGADLAKIIEAPVSLYNDADLAGLGEAGRGAGQGYKIVAYYTVSTGVGGTRIINGRIDKGVYSFEPGGQKIYADGQKSAVALEYDSLENFISGAALKKIHQTDPQDIISEKIWLAAAAQLALGLHNTLVHWSPEVVVLGGSLLRSIKIQDVKNSLQKIYRVYPHLPAIKKAQLGDSSGLYGALILAFN